MHHLIADDSIEARGVPSHFLDPRNLIIVERWPFEKWGRGVYRAFSNLNYWFKKAQKGFETIRQGSIFDNPLCLQSIFSKVMGYRVGIYKL